MQGDRLERSYLLSTKKKLTSKTFICCQNQLKNNLLIMFIKGSPLAFCPSSLQAPAGSILASPCSALPLVTEGCGW